MQGQLILLSNSDLAESNMGSTTDSELGGGVKGWWGLKVIRMFYVTSCIAPTNEQTELGHDSLIIL